MRDLIKISRLRSRLKGDIGCARCSENAEGGFTLIELLAVIVLVGLMLYASVANFDKLIGEQRTSALRQFVSIWEFLNSQAQVRDSSYRVYVNIDSNSYYVRREVPQPIEIGGAGRKVDHLWNLRTKSQKKRLLEKAKETQEDLGSLEEEVLRDTHRLSSSAVNTLFLSACL